MNVVLAKISLNRTKLVKFAYIYVQHTKPFFCLYMSKEEITPKQRKKNITRVSNSLVEQGA